MFNFNETSAEMKALLARAGDNNEVIAIEALGYVAKAIQTPLREGLLAGDIVSGIFNAMTFEPGVDVEFPLDFVAPGTQKDFTAYTLPNHGSIPERNIEGDYVKIPTYDIGGAIDWLLKYARNARWDIVGRATRVLEAEITKKMNDDGWHTLLAAGADRNIVVFDSDAGSGQFTKRLISIMKVIMRRNGGGNSATPNRSKLTDVFLSPESIEDIRNWGVDIVDEFTRREIFLSEDGKFLRIFSVNLHDIDELGEQQEYQNFYTNQIGGSLGTGKLELCVGLDMLHNDSFVMPIRQSLEVFPDTTMHRKRRAGMYAWMELGFASLDNRRIILGSI